MSDFGKSETRRRQAGLDAFPETCNLWLRSGELDRSSPSSVSTRRQWPPNDGDNKFGSETEDGIHGGRGVTALSHGSNREIVIRFLHR
jgi:hypothetical protein